MGITYRAIDPMFDPLRGDPRFEELCKGNQPLAAP